MQRAVGWCEAAVRNREGHFGAVSQERVDASASINEGGTAEDFKSFRPLLNSEETGAFSSFYSSLARYIGESHRNKEELKWQ